ncbi:hypothetical protein B0J13DRAFT_560246, partial [Dactylonectria estremocensis]
MKPQTTWPNSLSVPADELFTKEEIESVTHWPGRQSVVHVAMLGTSTLSSEMLNIAERLTQLPLDYYLCDPTMDDHERARLFKLEPGRAPVMLRCYVVPFPFRSSTMWDCDASMYVFSLTDRESFLALRESFAELAVPLQGEKPKINFVVAAQTDTPMERWVVSLEEAEQFSESIGADLLAVSAKTRAGCGLQEAKALVIRIRLRQIQAEKDQPKATVLDKSKGVLTRWKKAIPFRCGLCL